MEGVCKAYSSSEPSVPDVSEAVVNRDADEREGQQLPLERCRPVLSVALNEILILQTDLRKKWPLAHLRACSTHRYGGSCALQHNKAKADSFVLLLCPPRPEPG